MRGKRALYLALWRKGDVCGRNGYTVSLLVLSLPTASKEGPCSLRPSCLWKWKWKRDGMDGAGQHAEIPDCCISHRLSGA